MRELLEASLSAANLPLTVALGLIVLYWVSVILGALDINAFDFDLDPDVDLDTDVEIDTDADVDADAGAPGSIGIVVLRFFHVGRVPIMILLSFLVLSLWTISLLANDFLGNRGFVISAFLLIPNIVVSLFVTKFCTLPIRAIFDQLEDTGGGTIEARGQLCVIKSLRVDGKGGQAEVKTGAAPLLLNVRTRNGEVIQRGEEAVVVEPDQDKKTYFIARL